MEKIIKNYFDYLVNNVTEFSEFVIDNADKTTEDILKEYSIFETLGKPS